MRYKYLALTILALTGCGASTPVWYAGDSVRWSTPMVAPLENHEVLVPVMINGEGPFLFAVDPDSPGSRIDIGLAERLKLYTRGVTSWRSINDHSDRLVRSRAYEVLDLRMGDLNAVRLFMFSVPANSLKFSGRQVYGVIGSNLLSRTIVMDIDRDLGMLNLALVGHEQKWGDSAAVVRGSVSKYAGPFRKMVAKTRIGKKIYEMAIDFAANTTALQGHLLTKLGLAKVDEKEVVIDENGTALTVKTRVRAPLALGNWSSPEVDVIPLPDKRVFSEGYDGVIGQNVLARFRVLFNPDNRELWLQARDTDVGARRRERIGRWGDSFARCQNLGCATSNIEPDGALSVRRDANAPANAYTVVLQGFDASGGGVPGRLVRVSLTKNAQAKVSGAEMREAFPTATRFEVIDAEPFATACGETECAVIVADPTAPTRPTAAGE